MYFYDYAGQDPVNQYDLSGLYIPRDSRSYGAHKGRPQPGLTNGNAPTPLAKAEATGDVNPPGGIELPGGSVIPPAEPYDPGKSYTSTPDSITDLPAPVGSTGMALGQFWNDASYNHDVCYGSQFPRSQCDAVFAVGMLNDCGGDPGCDFFANIFYSAVRDFGASHYKPRQFGEP